MNRDDVQLGIKVVPHGKSLGCGLSQSGEYKRMVDKRQKFLYVVHQHMNDKIIGIDRLLLSSDEKALCGDYFKSTDFELFK